MTLTITTPTDREITMTRAFLAPRHLVFDCYTKPELIRRWMSGPPGWTFAICEIDLRVGGNYRYVWQNEAGHSMGMGGVYREILPPSRIVETQLFDQDWTGGKALGTLTLTEKDQQTIVTTTVLYPSKQARDGALQSGMEQGMKLGFDKLDELLNTL